MGKLVVGVQMYTLRKFCKTPEDISNTVQRLSKMGVRVIQVSAMGPIDPKELRKILDDNGIYAVSTHTSYDRIMNETDKVIEEHKILGCEAIMCPSLGEEQSNAGYLTAVDKFNKVIPKVIENGLIIGYHNHGAEFEKFDGKKTGLEMLMNNCKGLEAEIDVYWVQYAGGDPAYWIQKYSGRVSEVHFKDMGITGKTQLQPPIGEGNLNWERIVEACNKSGSRYCLIEQDQPTIEVFESIERSFKNILGMGAKAE